MRTNRCRQLRPLLTSYVDNEVSGRERLIVEAHLKQCHACRHRAAREEAVRQLLRSRSAEARASGAPLSWSAGSEQVNHRRVGTLLGIAAMSMVTVGIAFGIWSRWWVDPDVPLSARGQIDDSRCVGGHAHAAAQLMNLSGRECVHRCVEMGAHYVFVSQGVVYTIRNQDFAGLTRFAGEDVQLEGEVRQNLLTVSHVRPLTVGG